MQGTLLVTCWRVSASNSRRTNLYFHRFVVARVVFGILGLGPQGESCSASPVPFAFSTIDGCIW